MEGHVSTTSGPLAGDNVKAMTLNTETSGLSGSTLTLNFTSATSIPAGTPFIIKWDGDGTSNLVSPVFTGVTIDNSASTEVSFTGGSFKGSYSPVGFTANDKTKLFVGAENKLHWPSANMTLGACRAYFDLGTANASEFVLNFDGEEDNTTGIIEVKEVNASLGVNDNSWYDLSGRKLDKQPTEKGLYIHNGKKVVIK